MPQIIKIIVVDDHKIFRTGLELILNGIADVKVVGAASDAHELRRLLDRLEADLIFMDIKMPDVNGIELTAMIKEKFPSIKIIALSMFGEIEYFNMMMEAGADGFLLKNTQEDELAIAIHEVIEGRNYFSKEFMSTLSRTEPARAFKNQVMLSKREIEVLEFICRGYSNQEIARELHISAHTVDGHRRNLITKTGVKNSPSLVMFAIQNGLITLKKPSGGG